MSNNETTKLVDKIGLPAMLEMMAEESVELAHACQKAARLNRGENPAPGRTMDELMDHVEEEMADVYICLRELRKSQCINETHVSSAIDKKRERMNRRLGMRADSFIF